MRVCIIGAGAAGLCAARQSIHALKNVEKVVIYEQTESIGGTWVYTESTGTDSFGLPIHSSMYKNMKYVPIALNVVPVEEQGWRKSICFMTNLPKEVMSFPDFPFPSGRESFISHQSVLDYLARYSKEYGLLEHIKFRHKVLDVENISLGTKNEETWRVRSLSLFSGKEDTEDFTCVFVCNGHYFVPRIPEIAGLAEFAGRYLHSHNYRSPEAFSGQRVACLGSGSSGVDIAVELAQHSSQVYLCHDLSPLETYLYPNMAQKPGIERCTRDGVLLKNGELLDVDTIIFCTGYDYSFPFLRHEELPLRIENQRVTPLYQHLVHVEHPRLFFIGLCITICPFPQFHVQGITHKLDEQFVKHQMSEFSMEWNPNVELSKTVCNPQVGFCVSLLNGDTRLPSKERMYEWETQDYHKRMEVWGLRKNKAHFMGPHQWEYNRTLSELGGFPCPVPPVIQKLYDEIHKYRVKNVTTYKSVCFELSGDSEFRTL